MFRALLSHTSFVSVYHITFLIFIFLLCCCFENVPILFCLFLSIRFMSYNNSRLLMLLSFCYCWNLPQDMFNMGILHCLLIVVCGARTSQPFFFLLIPWHSLFIYLWYLHSLDLGLICYREKWSRTRTRFKCFMTMVEFLTCFWRLVALHYAYLMRHFFM